MSKIRIAIQKSGRLSDKSRDLLNECGINLIDSKSRLKIEATDYPLEVLLLRDDDIPQYVEDGIADIGILGENEVLEKKKAVEIVKKLGFSKCRLSLAVLRSDVASYKKQGIHWFNKKEIATSYPNILQIYLDKNQVTAKIREIGGSVEIAPTIGLAEGIFDIVSTGGTLLSNGLVEVDTLIYSEAVMIVNKNLSLSKQEQLEDLLFRIEAVLNAKNKKYVMLNAPKSKLEQITSLLPSAKRPTVMPLMPSLDSKDEEEWIAIHSVMSESEFWKIVRPLKQIGATGILSIPIEKIIPKIG